MRGGKELRGYRQPFSCTHVKKDSPTREAGVIRPRALLYYRVKYILTPGVVRVVSLLSMKDRETDEQIALRVQHGDREAFGTLVDRYEQKMLRYAHRFLYSYEDREDAVQEVFVRTYEHIQSFHSTERFSPWIYRIAHNVFINTIRKKGRERVSFVDLDTFFPSGIPEQTTEEPFSIPAGLEQTLASLDPKYREVLVLFYFEEKSYDEIADILHIPKATVGVRLARGRAHV